MYCAHRWSQLFLVWLLFGGVSLSLCNAEEKVYTDADLKPKPNVESKAPPLRPYSYSVTEYKNGRAVRGHYESFQPNPQLNVAPSVSKPVVQPDPYEMKRQADRAAAEAAKRMEDQNRQLAAFEEQMKAAEKPFYEMIALYILGGVVVFLMSLFCLIDIVRHEFTGYNKIIWFLAVVFVPIVGPTLYFFIGTDHKVKEPPDEEPITRLI